MKKNLASMCLGFFIAAFFGAGVVPTSPAVSQQRKLQTKWDYVVKPADEGILKEVVQEGWELIAVSKLEGQEGVKFIFKRQLWD